MNYVKNVIHFKSIMTTYAKTFSSVRTRRHTQLFLLINPTPSPPTPDYMSVSFSLPLSNRFLLVLPSPTLNNRCFYVQDPEKEINRWLRKNWGSSQGNVPIPEVSEFSWFQLACLHPALCPEWRQQDFPASFANIWCLELPARGGGAAGCFPSVCALCNGSTFHT